jgi:hypothetical protein
MNKGIFLFLLFFLLPGILYADIWNNSASAFYAGLYFLSVVPVLAWISNWVVFIQSLLRRKTSSFIFWAVIVANILFAVVSLFPVWYDLSHHNRDWQTNFTLIALTILPLILSIWSIYLRMKSHAAKNENDL